MSNTAALGHIIYTDYIFYFQTAGFILMVAMVGAIVLTLRHRPGVRRQSIVAQNARTIAESMELKNPRPGEGV
jgi:NADH-quinone oxidoreductase subunit J